MFRIYDLFRVYGLEFSVFPGIISSMKFNHVVCGGTFDHFHIGHKKLLKACFDHGAKVSIGITTMAMVRSKLYSHAIESYSIRAKNALHFAAENKKAISLIKLNDLYGSTLTDSTIDAIYVTEETRIGAEIINNERIKRAMKPLSIVVIPFVMDDSGDKISSERIRQGLINREGISYYKHLISRDEYILPDSLREVLREPLGRVISSLDSSSQVSVGKTKTDRGNQSYITHISVGDVVTYNLKKMGLTPSFSIIDGMTQRKALNKELFESILEKDYCTALNKKGTIQKKAITALYTLFTSGHNRAIKQLLIHGEEDLLTLVAILFAPLASHVWYGQKDEGAVDVIVTEKKKQIVYNLLRQFN